MDERQKAQSVGDIPSGLYIVCSQNKDEHKDGYLASWVQQASFKPLLISLSTVCFKLFTSLSFRLTIACKLF